MINHGRSMDTRGVGGASGSASNAPYIGSGAASSGTSSGAGGRSGAVGSDDTHEVEAARAALWPQLGESPGQFFQNAVASGSGGRDVVGGGVSSYIDPDSFDFRPGPGNSQKTSCVPIEFAYGSLFMAPMRFLVGVIVHAPVELRDGVKLSVREAQLDSANAAAAAAETIIKLSDSHVLIPSEVPPKFVGLMGGAILTTGLGYRVVGCKPPKRERDHVRKD